MPPQPSFPRGLRAEGIGDLKGTSVTKACSELKLHLQLDIPR
jgi:hypothetical protein